MSRKIAMLYNEPFNALLYRAQKTHHKNFPKNEIELCALLSIKTGSCPEDCAYCAQSTHHPTKTDNEALLDIDKIIAQAQQAKQAGASRFCMGAAWHNPPPKFMPKLVKIIKAIKNLGMETCMTLGQLDEQRAKQLKDAGLDFYNHNVNTSPNYYPKIATTHTYQDRVKTLGYIQQTGINTCCGIIIGMGESRQDRIDMLLGLKNLAKAPDSIPINCLVPIPGTPLADIKPIDNFEFIRTIAITRILFPATPIRLAAGRASMSDEMQALCFTAGANSIFFGDKLLTTANANQEHDLELLKKLNLRIKKS